MVKPGRPVEIQSEHRAVLMAIVAANPGATLDELRTELERRTGLRARGQTIRKTLREAGITPRPDEGAFTEAATADATLARPGAPRRGPGPERSYPSCLTDAEWALVEDLFDNEGGRGTPPHYPRRLLVDACCYVVRTGCSWRLLPEGFPPWQNVYRTFRRWSEQGKFDRMHARLRAQWRERERRAAAPGAGSVLDDPPGPEDGYDDGQRGGRL